MLNVEDLAFTYSKGKKRAVDGLSFGIEKGEIYGFLGPSGAGKTTTQRLIIGLLRNYEGSIRIFGKERSQWGKDFYEKVGVAFDFPNLYLKLTALENLQLIGSFYRQKPADVESLLERVGLLADKNTRTESFSKGMKMRLNFIRSIMHDPDIMFFDEPTSGLDPVNAHIIKEIILEQKAAGKTIFLTTHNMTVAEQLCDRVSFIVDGRIVVTGSPSNLMVEYGKRVVKVEYISEGKVESREFPIKDVGLNTGFLDIVSNYEIKTIHSCEATLEEIFIKLTGKNLI
ncbi:MAG: ABC transporter ATP-binding protein [Bacteroidales bacterium]